MKDKYKKLLRVIGFSAIAVGIFVFLNSLFQPAWYSWSTVYTAPGFYDEPENRIETVFLGPSVVVTGISPTELYDEYGICSYNLSSVRMPMLTSYYWLEEAYRLHSETLKTVVCDISMIRTEPAESYYRKALDYMELSDVKIRAVKDHAGDSYKEMLPYLVPFVSYHDRWNDLNASDINVFSEDLVNGLRGYHFDGRSLAEIAQKDVHLLNTVLDNEAEGNYVIESQAQYLYKMIDFCEEKGIKLVLMKTPTRKWSSALHNEIADIANENNLEFLDFNFSPLYDELGYVHAYDSFDGKHLNYYGASKLTKWMGQYLVDYCDATDVRGDDAYEYMEEQSREYNARIRQRVELIGAETAENYLELAINDENTVFVMVRGEASRALTDEQRAYFSDKGLEQLSAIGAGDSYIAIIDKQDIVYEELKVCSESSGGTELKYSGSLSGGQGYTISSGGNNDGNIASCSIKGTEHALNKRGINIVVYNNSVKKVLDSAVFDTYSLRQRETYTVDTLNEVLADPEKAKEDLYSIAGQVLRYQERLQEYRDANALRKNLGANDLFGLLDVYASEDNLVIMAGADDISNALTDINRKDLLEYKLPEYSKIGYGDSYIAIIDGGEVVFEQRQEGNTPLTIDGLGIYVKSSGTYAGATCSILLDHVEYAKKEKGLNIVVYNKAENRVITKECINTSVNALLENK